MSQIIRMISKDADVVVSVLNGKDIVAGIEKIHKTSAVVTAGLGRLTIAASLMGSLLKGDNDTLTLRINGGGATGTLLAVSDSKGNVKSYPQNSIVEIPLNIHGKLDVSRAVGRDGILSVVKDMGLKEPYVGQVPIVSGEIAEDIVSYYAISEQTPTVCGLGVLVNPDLTVNVAGGYLVQLLPFASDSCIDTIECNIQNLPSVTQMLSSGMNCQDIAEKLLTNLQPSILDDFEVEYKCDCSKTRVEKALISVGKSELISMADEQDFTEVSCHFCEKKYRFTSDEIRILAVN